MNKRCKNCGMPIKFSIDPTDFKWKPINKDGSWHWDTCVPDKKYQDRVKKRQAIKESKRLNEQDSFTKYYGG